MNFNKIDEIVNKSIDSVANTERGFVLSLSGPDRRKELSRLTRPNHPDQRNADGDIYRPFRTGPANDPNPPAGKDALEGVTPWILAGAVVALIAIVAGLAGGLIARAMT